MLQNYVINTLGKRLTANRIFNENLVWFVSKHFCCFCFSYVSEKHVLRLYVFVLQDNCAQSLEKYFRNNVYRRKYKMSFHIVQIFLKYGV